jgi:hypothetical protein
MPPASDNSSSTPDLNRRSSMPATAEEGIRQILADLRTLTIDLGSIEADRLEHTRICYNPPFSVHEVEREPNPYRSSLEELRNQRIRNQASADNSTSHIPLTAAQVALQIERDRRLSQSNSSAPVFHIAEPDRQRFRHELQRLFDFQRLQQAQPQSLVWFALGDLISQVAGLPQIMPAESFLIRPKEQSFNHYEQHWLEFTATYSSDLVRDFTPIDFRLELRADLELTRIELQSVTNLDRSNSNSITSRHLSAPPALDIEDSPRLRGDSDPRDRFLHHRMPPPPWLSADARSLGGLFYEPRFGHWVSDGEEIRMRQALARKKTSVPAACQGCANYFGETHGGNTVICGMYPYGPEGDSCEDFEAKNEA